MNFTLKTLDNERVLSTFYGKCHWEIALDAEERRPKFALRRVSGFQGWDVVPTEKIPLDLRHEVEEYLRNRKRNENRLS